MAIKIGGFQKNTLIDFPGVVASLIFTQGCNFRCPYCHNPTLIPFNISEPLIISELLVQAKAANKISKANISKSSTFIKHPDLIDESEIFAFLKKRKGLIDGVAITGGEPTLQPSIDSFCFKIKNMGLKVKIDTNGSKPDVIDNLLKRELVDFIAMDIKSNKAGYNYLVNIRNSKSNNSNNDFALNFASITKSIGLITKYSPDYEFRTTCIKPFITTEIMPEIGKMIKGASKYVLQHCSKNVEFLNPAFFEKNNPYPDPFFSDSELNELKIIAEHYVGECIIR